MKNRKMKPHEEDVHMDVLSVSGMESKKDLQVRVHTEVDKKTGATRYRGKVTAAQMLGIDPLPSPK